MLQTLVTGVQPKNRTGLLPRCSSFTFYLRNTFWGNPSDHWPRGENVVSAEKLYCHPRGKLSLLMARRETLPSAQERCVVTPACSGSSICELDPAAQMGWVRGNSYYPAFPLPGNFHVSVPWLQRE